MGRVEKRMYRRARGQRMLRRVLLALTAAVIVLGLALRSERGGLDAQHVPQPTATPMTRSFDETILTREIALEAADWFAIQTGIYSTRESAEENAGLYTQRGAPGYVNHDGEKWRVYIACYGDKSDAAAVRERLSTNQAVETYLHTWSCPGITLRLTGMAGQVDIAEAGLKLMLNAAAALRDNAAQLDGGEISQQEAQAVIAALNEQISLWLETAQARFTRPYPQLLESEMAQAAAWSQRHKTLQGEKDATSLSAQMKLQAMAIYDSYCDMRQGLMN